MLEKVIITDLYFLLNRSVYKKMKKNINDVKMTAGKIITVTKTKVFTNFLIHNYGMYILKEICYFSVFREVILSG